jgi:hypothetical protein
MINRTHPAEIGAMITDGDVESPLEALRKRVNYISAADHDNHKGKIVKPARNHNCPGQSKDDFVTMAERLRYAYEKRGQGNRTRRLFDEIVYSSDNGAHLTDQERELIETVLIADLCPHAAVRTAWHVDPLTGRSDLHILLSATDENLKVIFGRAVGNAIMAFQRLDRAVAAMLNTNPDRASNQQTAAIDVHAEKVRLKYRTKKVPSLSEQIARKFPGTTITAANIGDALAALGHTVKEITKAVVRVTFRDCHTVRPFPLRELLLQIGEAQVAILKRIRKKKLTTIAKQIAKKSRREVTAANLHRTVLELGYDVERTTEKSTWIRFRGKVESFPIRDLLRAAREAQGLNATAVEPTAVEPTTAEPTTAEPTTAEPTTAEPTTAEPTAAEPTTAEPTAAEPTAAEPTAAEPTAAEPTAAEPTAAEPTAAKPTAAKPTTTKPTTTKPTTTKPTTTKPTTTKPTTNSIPPMEM